MEDCLFCKIIKGDIPCTKVYENDKVLAFLDIGPVNKGHTLVIPKIHSKNIFDIEEEDLCEVNKVIRKIAPAIKKAVNADGLNIKSSNGAVAGQAIMHFHTHIIPRFEGDGLKLWPQGKYEEGEADKVAEEIKSNL
ncbi:MAG: HIT family protein [Candidatus Woesearchaeota archaeon]